MHSADNDALAAAMAVIVNAPGDGITISPKWRVESPEVYYATDGSLCQGHQQDQVR